MPYSVGILAAFIALVSWGVGDFFIQKTVRRIGGWKAVFFIGILGFLGLLPFVFQELFILDRHAWLLLGIVSLVGLSTVVFDFEALRTGKIAVVEPIIGFELPLTVCLGVLFLHESLTLVQIGLIVIVAVGLMLAVTQKAGFSLFHRRMFERGVLVAGICAVSMAVYNYLVGVATITISPLMTIWVAHTLLFFVSAIRLLMHGQIHELWADVRHNPVIIGMQSILDNVAWIAYAVSMSIVPVSIATTISEGYIALAVLLGLVVSREKLRAHQVWGVAMATGGIILLTYFSS